MTWVDAIMQYSIYIVLGLCLTCLFGALAIFLVLERRWQDRVEHDAEEIMARSLARQAARENVLSPLQWEELRHRIGEMQIMAEENDRPRPYKNVA